MSLKGILGDTPILCKKAGQLCYLNVEQIGTEWHNDECIPTNNTNDIKVYTGVTFVPITKIVRYNTFKEIFRILTDAGCVEVNKDHPLLTIDNKKVLAKKLDIDQQLLVADRPQPENTIHIHIPGAYAYGLYYYANNFKKTDWYIEHHNNSILITAWESMVEKYPDITFHIIKNPNENSNNQWRLEPVSSNDSVKIWAEWDVNNLLQADSQSQCEFLGGLLNDGSRHRYIYTIKSKKLAAIICHLNYHFCINYKADDIIIVTGDICDYNGWINEIKELPIKLYTVYNIECDGDCYQAGIGRCIV